MSRRRAIPFEPSKEMQAIRAKLNTHPDGSTLTRTERGREIVKEEAAYLLSALAGRTINQRYVKELTREDKGARLKPSRIVGTVFFYKVESLLAIKFNKMQHQEEATP